MLPMQQSHHRRALLVNMFVSMMPMVFDIMILVLLILIRMMTMLLILRLFTSSQRFDVAQVLRELNSVIKNTMFVSDEKV